MTWILIIVISIMSNDKSWEPRAYEIITKSNFGMCTMAKSDIDYIFMRDTLVIIVMMPGIWYWLFNGVIF